LRLIGSAFGFAVPTGSGKVLYIVFPFYFSWVKRRVKGDLLGRRMICLVGLGLKKSSSSGRKFTPKVPVPEVPAALMDEVDLWLRDSDDSLKVARDNMALGNYHVAVLYTHQAVEKALKVAS